MLRNTLCYIIYRDKRTFPVSFSLILGDLTTTLEAAAKKAAWVLF